MDKSTWEAITILLKVASIENMLTKTWLHIWTAAKKALVSTIQDW